VTVFLQRGAGLKQFVAELAIAGKLRFLPPGAVDLVTFTDLATPEDYTHLPSRSRHW